MKKRIRQLMMLVSVLLLALTGCQDTEEPVNQEEPIVQEETDIVIEEVTDSEETEEEEIPLSVQVQVNHKTHYFDEEEMAYLYLQYCDVTLEGSRFEKLKRNVENWSLERSENLRSLYAELEEQAKEEEKARGKDFYGYTLYQTVSTARADESVVSLIDETYQYTGGENGTFYYEGVNFDAKSGKRLALKDILIDGENFEEEAMVRITSELNRLHGEALFEDYEQTVADLWQGENEPQWYLDATGIVIIIQQYAVGPYNVGTTKIHLPYQQFKHAVKEAYLPTVSDGVAHIEKNEEVYLELPNREEPLQMMLQYQWEEYMTNCALWLGEDKTTMSDFATMEDAYLIRNGEEVYCLVELDMASDDYVTYVYRLTNGVIDEVAVVSGAIDAGNVNTQQVMLECWVDMLGTYGGVKTYRFDENRGFTTSDTEYRFIRNEQVLTTIADLPVMLEGSENTLPAGSHIILNATDNESYVTFTIQETGQTGVLQVERNKEEYQIMVNGMSEYDCFEMLPYAG